MRIRCPGDISPHSRFRTGSSGPETSLHAASNLAASLAIACARKPLSLSLSQPLTHTLQIGHLLLSKLVAGKDSGLNVHRFSDQDRGVRVVLLHGRVGAGQEGSVGTMRALAVSPSANTMDGKGGDWGESLLRICTQVAGHVIVPDGVAVVAGLAVVEAQLLERLAEDVFA